MEIADCAYAAGLIDGEGSIGLEGYGSGSNFRSPYISMSSTTTELTDYMLQYFGGHISIKRRHNANPNHSQAFVWKIRGHAALTMLELIGDYLREEKKREKSDKLRREYLKVTKPNGKYTEIERARKIDFQNQFLEIGTSRTKLQLSALQNHKKDI